MLFRTLPTLSAIFTLIFLTAQSVAVHVSINDALRVAPLARAAGTPDEWTNAQRFAAGLPPNAPRRIKRGSPTVARRPAPSPSPSLHWHKHTNAQAAATDNEKSYTGRLQARTVANNATLGFVRLSPSGVALGGDNFDGTPVSFIAVGLNPFSIATTDSTPVYIGAVGTTAISRGSASTAILSTVSETTAHARPVSTGSESAIWNVDASTLRLTPLWVNPDGSHARATLAYSKSSGAFVLTGDIGAYNDAHPNAALSEVALYLVN